MEKARVMNSPSLRPKVLVLGNGLLRAFANGARCCRDLEELLYEVSGATMPTDIDTPTIPFPMRVAASFASLQDCDGGITKTVKSLIFDQVKGASAVNNLLCNSKVVKAPFFKRLLKAGLTDVITTNYGYEIEQVLGKRCPTAGNIKSDFYKNFSFPKGVGIKEYKFKIWKHYRFPLSDTRIWHIHGEYLKPQSIIFDYSDYCSFLVKVKDYPKPKPTEDIGDNLSKELRKSEMNWIDAFHRGDVYILGFSSSFAEPVFWWAMQRKKRNRSASGKVVFYEPTFAFKNENGHARNQRQKEVLAMMAAFGAEHRDMGMTISDNSQFLNFYENACEDITAEINGLRKGM